MESILRRKRACERRVVVGSRGVGVELRLGMKIGRMESKHEPNGRVVEIQPSATPSAAQGAVRAAGLRAGCWAWAAWHLQGGAWSAVAARHGAKPKPGDGTWNIILENRAR